MRMRLIPIFALLLVPATAEARTLYLKQARTISARIAQGDPLLNQHAPNWAGTPTTPACVRRAKTRATCDYTINYTRTDRETSQRRYCLRRVAVTLTRSGKAVGRLMTELDCALQKISERDPDYEA